MNDKEGIEDLKDLTRKKVEGRVLTNDDIKRFVTAVSTGRVDEKQIGELLRAIKSNDLNLEETEFLTKCMKSDDVITWPESSKEMIVDKHSTGGVGDKTSLVLVPILACCGLKIPMVSGRGLEHTGGTLDKLESIPGVNVDFPPEKIEPMVDKIGCCIVGQTKNFVAADKELYRLRDLTGTVDSNGLIASSILCKKAAAGIKTLLLDVKCGKAAFKKTQSDAEELANLMVEIANRLGVRTTALITQMDRPIGLAIGNALEIVETLRCLRWRCPECGESKKCTQCRGCQDILGLVYEIGEHLLCNSGVNRDEAKSMMEEKVRTGKALKCFEKIIIAQGASVKAAESLCDPNTDFRTGLPTAKHITSLTQEENGYVHDIDAMKCGEICWNLGAGRSKSGDNLKMGVGLELQVCYGDEIKKGDVWVKVHHDTDDIPADVQELLKQILVVKDQEVTNTNGSRVLKVIPP
ncbi:thymidine phosphorylase-like [Ylistrum balloti]|uniref:thymidine phosphorylase-like n=1 Tax=Ylistrum balloti TaxID=509963 RepID=UPI002905C054|nr:thymidine phosphorylase-like [Ylistrum balloti]